MTSNDAPATNVVGSATTIAPRLKLAYRCICVALVVAAVALLFNLVDQSKRSQGDADEAVKQRSQLQEAENTLANARKLRDELKELVARGQQELAAAEHAKAAAAAH
jgi:Tfp pilus assembly protein PilO